MASSFAVDIVEEDVQLTLAELCRACRAPETQVRIWVIEGVLSPLDASPADRADPAAEQSEQPEQPEQWRFAGPALRRAKLALTLTRELEINAPGVAFALDLMDQIDALKARLRRMGAG